MGRDGRGAGWELVARLEFRLGEHSGAPGPLPPLGNSAQASRRLDRHRAAMSSRTERHAGGGWRNWFFGIVLAAALIGAVLHWGEVKGFAALVERARPEWLGLAIALQLSTYASVAAGWAAVLRRAGTRANSRRSSVSR